MDNKLNPDDPYRGMQSAEQEIQPDFLNGIGDTASGVLSAAENAAGAIMAAKGGKVPTKGVGAGGVAGAGGTAKPGDAKPGNAKPGDAKKTTAGDSGAGANKDGQGGYYNKGKTDSLKGNKSDLNISGGAKTGLKVALPLLILVIGGILAIIALIVAVPVILIGALDFNMLKGFGFGNTVSLLEKVGEFVTAEFMTDGDMPTEYASSLAANGVEVGQVLANGDFVRTNTYIADIGSRDDLVAAAGGFSYISDDDGELAMLYDGKIIRADEFVAEVESDPVLYAAYSEAANLDTKYYYGKDVTKVFEEGFEITRGEWNDWESTGNYKKDEEEYYKILEKTLNRSAEIAVNGYYNDKDLASNPKDITDEQKDSILDSLEGEGTFSQKVSGVDGKEVASNVAENTKEYILEWGKNIETVEGKQIEVPTIVNQSQDATKRAAELLNTSIAAGEPYVAANTFISIEEPLQMARVDGSGLVNIMMNTISKRTPVSYQNVETGEMETKNLSILETKNFRAVVSDAEFSTSEAQNFSQDRILKVTGQADKDTIQSTTVSDSRVSTSDTETSNSNGVSTAAVSAKSKLKNSSVVRNGKVGESADAEIIAKAADSIDLAQASKNYDNFQSVIGGNRIVNGGRFLSDTINMQVIGAMPSDDHKITAYHKEVEEMVARKAEADRATKSPFDISSPNTFMGSIVHNMATTLLGNYNAGMTVLSAVTAAGSTTGNAIANLTGTVNAASSKDLATTYGASCETVKTVEVEGNLYCASHNTPSTAHIDYTMGDFKNSEIGDQIGDDGEILEGTGLWEFVHLGMSRYSTVGVKNAEICQKYRDLHPEATSIWTDIKDFFSKIGDTYDVCNTEDVEGLLEVATGAKYTFGPEGDGTNELYSSYVLYSEVRSLLKGTQSPVSKSREGYREKHPLDNSKAGVVARRSGMTKHEAEIALAYADYLTMIASYDPSTRFDFTAPVVSFERPILEKESDGVALSLYAWYSKETEYSDLRTRNFVV